ncbi:helix-turn-helix domain-containing protein [Candidatus Microgenomates bacterium]|nr:helix-turn-helix domain-containing protein [Candidatus Microgenomates bacterium]
MRSIGPIIKEARARKKLSVRRLSARTKIRQTYILALETEQWNKLPSLSVTQGFVKNIAGALGVDREEAAALLRRDFQEKKQVESTRRTAIWTPRVTAITTAGIVVVFLAIYLFKQYSSYAAPPPLTLGELKKEDSTVVFSGKTHENAQVLVNDAAVLVGDDGKFEVKISAESGDKLIIKALSRSGRATTREVIVP